LRHSGEEKVLKAIELLEKYEIVEYAYREGMEYPC